MKNIFYLFPFLAIFLFTACEDENVAQNHVVSITITASDFSLNETKILIVTATNTKTSRKMQTTVSHSGVAQFILPTGYYNFEVTGTHNDNNIVGCQNNVEILGSKSFSLTLYYASNSSLIFKEVYYTGVMNYYFKDAFYEIYNNSDKVQYLDGLILGVVDNGLPIDVETSAPSVWVDESGSLIDRYPMHSFTMYFPGQGMEYPLAPGKSVVVAVSAIDHSARELSDEEDVASPVNLVNADWEMYCTGKTILLTDNPDVPNLKFAYKNMGIQFMPATSGQALILAKLPKDSLMENFLIDMGNFMIKPGTSKMVPHLMIPSEYVLDAIDIVPMSQTERFKHIRSKDDVGMVWINGTNGGFESDASYSGKSLRRKVQTIVGGRVVFKDTNNSSEDFILGGSVPTPGVIPTSIDE